MLAKEATARDFSNTYVAINNHLDSTGSPFERTNDYGEKSSSFRQWSDSFRAKNVYKNRVVNNGPAQEILRSPESKFDVKTYRLE